MWRHPVSLAFSVSKNIKRFAEIENLDLLQFCVLPTPQKHTFLLPVDNLITAGEKMWL